MRSRSRARLFQERIHRRRRRAIAVMPVNHLIDLRVKKLKG
jgi:hypothetical protein